MSDELITIATFPEPAEANMARTVLEGFDILVNLRSENANNMIPIAFETQLQVRAEDAETAKRILDEAVAHPTTEADVIAAEQEAERGE